MYKERAEAFFPLQATTTAPDLSMFAPPICRRRWRNNAFPLRQIRRRRRQPSEHRSERSEQSDTSAMREQLKTQLSNGWIVGA